MTVRTRAQILIMVALAVLVLSGGFTFRSVQRVARLRGLQTHTEVALQYAFRLMAQTNVILYSTRSVDTLFDSWRRTIQLTDEGIAGLAAHPGLSLLEEDLTERAGEAAAGWSAVNFSLGLCEQYLNDAMALVEEADSDGSWFRVGISRLTDAAARAVADGAGESAELALASLRRTTVEFEHVVVALETFVTDSLDGLGDRVGAAADEVVRQTTRLTAIAVVLLVLFVVVVLLLSIRYLNQAVRGLETVVEQRTRSIRSLLDFSGQGFLSFGNDLLVRAEYSRDCESIFGQQIGGKYLPDLMYPKGQPRDDFEHAMDLIFSKKSRPDVVFGVLDQEATIEGRIIHLEYRVIDDDSMMLSLTDITEQRDLQERISAEKEAREMVLRAAMNRTNYVSLTREAEEVFRFAHSLARDTGNDANQHLLRSVHTFKANAAFLRMRATAEAAHRLEERIEERLVLADDESIGPVVDEMIDAFEKENEQIRAHLGQEWSQAPDTLSVKEEHVRRLEDVILSRYPDHQELVNLVEDMRRVSLGDLLARLSESVQSLADSRAKRLKPLRIEGADVRVRYDEFAPVLDAIKHLLRNMVDHGIEYPAQRQEAGKDVEGEICISAHETPSHIEIRLTDDGGGVPLDKIEAKAREMGLVDGNVTRADLLKLLFRDGFSTAESVSEVSGRGVGLSAVRASMREVGGSIGVSTRSGRGTTFSLKFARKREK